MSSSDVVGCVSGNPGPFIDNILREIVKDILSDKPVAEQQTTPSETPPLPDKGPFLKIVSLEPDRPSVSIGETVTIKGTYTAVNGEGLPIGTFSLSFGQEPLASKDMELSQQGTVEFTKELPMKKGLKTGTYRVRVDIDYCGLHETATCDYYVTD